MNPFLHETLMPHLVRSFTENSEETPDILEEDYQKAMAVLKDILNVYQQHEVTPIEGYTIAASLADAIYAVLTNVAEK